MSSEHYYILRSFIIVTGLLGLFAYIVFELYKAAIRSGLIVGQVIPDDLSEPETV
jgi:hypothetical protein